MFALSKLKALADDKVNVTLMTISVFHRVENIMGKGENMLGYKCFQNPSLSGLLKLWIVQKILFQTFNPLPDDEF